MIALFDVCSLVFADVGTGMGSSYDDLLRNKVHFRKDVCGRHKVTIIEVILLLLLQLGLLVDDILTSGIIYLYYRACLIAQQLSMISSRSSKRNYIVTAL